MSHLQNCDPSDERLDRADSLPDVINLETSFISETFELLSNVSGDAPAPSFEARVFNSLADAVVVVNTDSTIARVNPAALRLTGFREQELVSRSIEDLSPKRVYFQNFSAARSRAWTYPDASKPFA